MLKHYKNLLKIAYDNKFKCIFLHKAVFDKDKQTGSFLFFAYYALSKIILTE